MVSGLKEKKTTWNYLLKLFLSRVNKLRAAAGSKSC